MRNAKTPLRHSVGDVKLTFEEFTSILTQVEAFLHSRPLVPINSPNDNGIKVFTTGHSLIGQPPSAVPDTSPVALCPYCAGGTSVKISFAISGRDGWMNICHHSTTTGSGDTHHKTWQLGTLLC